MQNMSEAFSPYLGRKVPKVVLGMLVLAGILYCAALVVIAIFPWPPAPTWLQWLTAAAALAAMFGLGSRLIPGVYLPGERWAFLVVGAAGLITLIFVLTLHDPWWIRTRLGLVILAGMLMAFGTHLMIPVRSVKEAKAQVAKAKAEQKAVIDVDPHGRSA